MLFKKLHSFYANGGLQRIISVTNTPNGDLSYSYLADNSISVTNGKGHTTTTKYRAYGTPATDLPVEIAQPESAVTTLLYSVLDLPVEITQGGVTETRRYNNKQQMCLQIRPDTGLTAYDYTVLGQVKTYAAGLAGAGAHCTDYTPNTGAVITHSYDNLGALSSISYGDAAQPKAIP